MTDVYTPEADLYICKQCYENDHIVHTEFTQQVTVGATCTGPASYDKEFKTWDIDAVPETSYTLEGEGSYSCTRCNAMADELEDLLMPYASGADRDVLAGQLSAVLDEDEQGYAWEGKAADLARKVRRVIEGED